jgi:hypothetical protein
VKICIQSLLFGRLDKIYHKVFDYISYFPITVTKILDSNKLKEKIFEFSRISEGSVMVTERNEAEHHRAGAYGRGDCWLLAERK